MRKCLFFFVIMLFMMSAHRTVTGQYAPGNGPAAFQENNGQIHDQYYQPRTDIDARLGQNGFQVFVGKDGLHYQWVQAHERPKTDPATKDGFPGGAGKQGMDIARIDVVLLGANPRARLRKENRRPEYHTYYNVKNAPDGIRAHNYDKLVYEDIYPHIDWVIYTQKGKMKYDFVVRPGGKVSDIRLQYKGATGLALEASGDLVVSSALGKVSESAPFVYEEQGKEISSRYLLHNDVLSFAVAPYSGTLIIDPSVDWASYFGDAGALLVTAEGIKVDNGGDVYINGIAFMSQNLATKGVYQTTVYDLQPGFLARFDTKGLLKWCTYYGGDAPVVLGNKSGIVIDSAGNITIAGVTDSTTFGIVTPGAYQTVYGGSSGDIFLMQFSPDGQRKWGSFLGGEGDEMRPSIATYGNHIYIGGIAGSRTNIATAGSYKPSVSNTTGRVRATFLAKLNLAGTTMEWSTYFDESASGDIAIALDPAGNAYMLSGTYATTGIATAGAFQPNRYSARSTCGTIAKFTGVGNLSWATFWGGENELDGFWGSRAITVDNNFSIYLAMNTKSKQYIATPGSYQENFYGGDADVCLMRMDSSGKRIWATYLGGEAEEYPQALTVGDGGDVWVAGYTSSTQNISTSTGLNNVFQGMQDGFMQQYDSSGRKKWASYYGGDGEDVITNAEFNKGFLYFVGYTNTTDSSRIATSGVHQSSYPGTFLYSSMVGRLCFSHAPAAGILGPAEVCARHTFRYSASPVDNAEEYLWSLPAGWQINGSGPDINIRFDDAEDGILELRIVRCGDTSAVMQLPISVLEPEKPVVRIEIDVLSTMQSFAYYQWYLNGTAIAGATGSTHKVLENGSYTVVAGNSKDCMDTSAEYVINNLSVAGPLPGAVRLYPNPVQQGILYIEAAEPVSLFVYSMEGRLVKSAVNVQDMSTADLASGSYMVYIRNKEGHTIAIQKVQVLQP